MDCISGILVDITKHLNEVNLNLKGKNKLITSIYDNVSAFQTKLRPWKCQLKNGKLVHFKSWNG
jgi:hypothetical protein